MKTTTDPTITVPSIGHREAVELAAVAYGRFADLVESLMPEDWSRPTDCAGWNVRDLVGHMVGAMRSAASVQELLSQQREVKRRHKRDGGNETDHMTAVQIERTAGLDTAEVVAECRALVAKATAGRRRIPAPVRRFVTFPVEFGSTTERWRLGYLVDLILTRDAWLHRIDLARSIGTEPVLTADHDGRLVADVVAEWARRHGEPYSLILTGPAGGTYAYDSACTAEPITLDAVEFCRILSNRVAGKGLLATEVPF